MALAPALVDTRHQPIRTRLPVVLSVPALIGSSEPITTKVFILFHFCFRETLGLLKNLISLKYHVFNEFLWRRKIVRLRTRIIEQLTRKNPEMLLAS